MHSKMTTSAHASPSRQDEQWRRTFISRLVRSDVVDWVAQPEETSAGTGREADRAAAATTPSGRDSFEAIAAIAAKASKGKPMIDPASDFLAEWDRADRRRKTRRELLSLAIECSRWSRNLRRTVGLTVLIACTTVSSMIFQMTLGDDGFDPQAQVAAAFAASPGSGRFSGAVSPPASTMNGGVKTAENAPIDPPEPRLEPASQAPDPAAATNSRAFPRLPPARAVEKAAPRREALAAARADVATVHPSLPALRPTDPRDTGTDDEAPSPRLLPFEPPMALGHQPRTRQQPRAIELSEEVPAKRAKDVARERPAPSRQVAERSAPKPVARPAVKLKPPVPTVAARVQPAAASPRPAASRESVSAWSPFRDLH